MPPTGVTGAGPGMRDDMTGRHHQPVGATAGQGQGYDPMGNSGYSNQPNMAGTGARDNVSIRTPLSRLFSV